MIHWMIHLVVGFWVFGEVWLGFILARLFVFFFKFIWLFWDFGMCALINVNFDLIFGVSEWLAPYSLLMKMLVFSICKPFFLAFCSCESVELLFLLLLSGVVIYYLWLSWKIISLWIWYFSQNWHPSAFHLWMIYSVSSKLLRLALCFYSKFFIVDVDKNRFSDA